MQHHKLNLRNRPLLKQLTNCEQHVTNLNALPPDHLVDVNLPRVSASVAAARASFDQVAVLRSQLKTEIARRNQLIRTARRETTYAVGMVAVNVNGKPAAMVAAGLELERTKSPVGLPGAITYFHATPHTDEGIVLLRWKRPLRRCAFMIQISTESKPEWMNHESSAATKCVLERLKSGVKYWFRVCAVNAHGSGPWSQPVSARVK